MPLPGIGGNFKSLELANHVQSGAFTYNLCTRRDVLPAQQPAHELRRSDRLDLLAKRRNCKPMNAGQKAAFTPFV